MLGRRSFLRVRPAPAHPTPAVAAAPADLRPFVPTAGDPWDAAKARHLLRRTTLAALPDDVEALAALTPAQAADEIVAAARRRPDLAAPDWIGARHPGYGATATDAQRAAFDALNKDALNEVLRGVQNRLLGDGQGGRFARLGTALRERMTMLWANHYVTELRAHSTATWAFDYLRILHRHALGRVPAVVDEVTTTPAMLRYLNGDQNRVGQPNENYARELLELFTMGTERPDGTATYAQADVSELARALTGWRTSRTAPDLAYFEPRRFDAGDKTVFGQTGPWGTADVVPLLVAQRPAEIARFIGTVLYRAFVADEPDPGVVAALAARLQADGFDVGPAVADLLQSAHFYADAHVGALVKSPADLVLGSSQAFGVDALDDAGSRYVRNQMLKVDQELLNPPDVSGWPGGPAWIDTSTLPERVLRGQEAVRRSWPAIADAAAQRPAAYDARGLAAEIAAEMLPRPPADADLDGLTDILLSGTPAYAWDPASAGGRTRVRDYVAHLVSLPEYQLR